MIKHWLMWGAAAVIGAPSAGGAQQMQVALGASEQLVSIQQAPSTKLPVKDPLSITVSLELNDVSRKAALDAIAQETGIQVIYSRAVVSLEQRVSISARNMTLAKVLDQVLAGTKTVATPMADGSVVIARAASVGQRQASGVVQGKVVHAETKQAIAGARIVLNAKEQEVQSDAQGRFRFDVSAGSYTLHVRAVGFVQKSQRVTVTDEGSVTIEVLLEPSANVLDEIVVTGTVVATERKAIPNPITVITAEEIERRGITRIEQFLRGEVPGVIALDKGIHAYTGPADGATANTDLGSMQQTDVYARGVSNIPAGAGAWEYTKSTNQLKTFIDGVEVLDASYIGTIDPQAIERIEIITGPQAATIYGSGAMGGVMQIFTKKSAKHQAPEISLHLQQGVLQNNISRGLTPKHDQRLRVSGSNGPGFSYSATIGHQYSGQWQPNLFARQLSGALGSTFTRGPVVVSGSVNLTSGRNGVVPRNNGASPAWKAKVTSGEWAVREVATYTTRSIATSSSQTLALNMDYQLFPNWHHRVTAGRNQTALAMIPQQPRYASSRDTVYFSSSSNGQRITAGYNTTYQVPQVNAFSTNLTLGFNGSWADQDQIYGYLASDAANMYLTDRTLRVTKLLNSDSWGGFANWQLGLFDRLYLTLGLRGERNPSYGTGHSIDWTPTNGVAYTQNVGMLTIKALASYGRATRAPTPAMRLPETSCIAIYVGVFDPACWETQIGAPDIRPEYSRGPQGGIEVYIGNYGSFTLNRYVQNVTDLIQNIVVDSVPRTTISTGASGFWEQKQYHNIASIRQHGWESTGSVNLGRISLKGTYSWMDARITQVNNVNSGYTRLYEGMTFNNVPTHAGYLQVSYTDAATSITISTSMVGKVNSDNFAVRTQLQNNRLEMYAVRQASMTGEIVYSGYAKSDINVSHRLSRSASLTLNVVNAANQYTSDQTWIYPTLGRQTTLGVLVRLP